MKDEIKCIHSSSIFLTFFHSRPLKTDTENNFALFLTPFTYRYQKMHFSIFLINIYSQWVYWVNLSYLLRSHCIFFLFHKKMLVFFLLAPRIFWTPCNPFCWLKQALINVVIKTSIAKLWCFRTQGGYFLNSERSEEIYIINA